MSRKKEYAAIRFYFIYFYWFIFLYFLLLHISLFLLLLLPMQTTPFQFLAGLSLNLYFGPCILCCLICRSANLTASDRKMEGTTLARGKGVNSGSQTQLRACLCRSFCNENSIACTPKQTKEAPKFCWL